MAWYWIVLIVLAALFGLLFLAYMKVVRPFNQNTIFHKN